MECKAPGTLKEWVDLYIENDWVSCDELFEIELTLLPEFGPYYLYSIIEKAMEFREDYEEVLDDGNN